MLPSSPGWGLFGIVIAATACAVYVTNVFRSPRILRILARNAFLLSVLLLAYQLVTVALMSSGTSVSKVPAPAVGDSVVGGPSVSASFVNQVLSDAGTPAVGTGQALYDLSVQYHIDDAYALATFEHESSYGKYGYAAADHSLGNIICAGYPTCNGRYRWYATWREGYEDFYQLIAHEYVARGLTTVGSIIQVYAPPTENDTAEYIQSLRSAIRAYRSGQEV